MDFVSEQTNSLQFENFVFTGKILHYLVNKYD